VRSGPVVAIATLCTALRLPAQAPAPAAFSTAPKLTGYLQPRFQTLGDTASFLLRRARFTVDGNITPWASYRAQVEMRTLGAAPTPAASPLTLSATDLYIRLTHRRWGGTVGQFRVPFALEALLSSTALETSERSRIVNSAKRDIGVQADWTLAGRLVLQTAVVNGDGPNRTTSTNPDNRMAYFARAVVTPVKGFEIGGAFEGYTDSSGANVQSEYRTARWVARAEYIDEHNRRTDVHTRGWYGLAGYYAIPQRVELVGRVEQFDPSNLVATDRSTGYLVGLQYFMRGDNFKILADYEVFREQVVQLSNNRGVVQLQVRW
jgi:phosphate-selective porin OprO and OprP